jgi:methionyl-tRNA formyltransferase
MMQFGFYILGKKGYESLKSLISVFGSECISFVVVARDGNIEDDFFESIQKLCFKNEVPFSDKPEFKDRDASFRFSIGWRWIISNPKNLIVFHDSLLPKYRGFAPLVNALVNGENRIGVTALKAEAQYDRGDICDQREVSANYPLKIAEAIEIISGLYSEMLVDICRKLIYGEKVEFIKQDSLSASYSLWRNQLDYSIDWRKSSKYISRFIDSVGYPYKGAETTINGAGVRLIDCKVAEDVKVEARADHIGKVIFMRSGRPIVVCGDGLLEVIDVINDSGESLVGKIPFRSRFGF